MRKIYTDYTQQVQILSEKGIAVEDKKIALKVLEREGYYNLINGYKDLFLKSSINGEDRFKEGTTFEEIHDLYQFDREMRNLLFGYFLKFETTMKSLVTDRFCSQHNEIHAYLEMNNYAKNSNNSQDILLLISTLYKIIQKEEKRKGPIKHYLENHDYVPLWVVVNFMTFGNIQKMYTCLPDSIKNEIAKYFSIEYKKSYEMSIFITPEILISILKPINFFRNVCAHEERLYSYKMHKKPETKQISSILGISSELMNKGNLFMAVTSLKLVLPQYDYEILKQELEVLFKKYSPNFKSIKFEVIMEVMGFNEEWNTFL